MDLDLTEDQEAICTVFAAFFDGETGPARAREAEPTGFDAAAWERLLETGAPGMGVPEAAGGGGASLADPTDGPARACLSADGQLKADPTTGLALVP